MSKTPKEIANKFFTPFKILLGKLLKAVTKIKLPKLSTQLYMPILVILLLISTFLLGVLFTKVQYLEKGTVTGTANQQGADNTQGQPASSPASAPKGPVNVSVGSYPVLGDTNAKVTVIEFADYQCPFCEQWYKEVESNLMQDYVNTGKVKFAFRNYAFLGQESTDAANAAACANDQNRFWDYHNYLYEHQGAENSGTFSKDNLKSFAATLGLNTNQFNTCLDSGKFADEVTKDQTEGSAVGVDGTPATFVDGQLISGAEAYSTFKTLIDTELAK